jgi:hypothetical protein
MAKSAADKIQNLQKQIALTQQHAQQPKQFPNAAKNLAKLTGQLQQLQQVAGPAGENAPTEQDRQQAQRDPTYPYYNPDGSIQERGVVPTDTPRPGQRYAPKPAQGDTITSGYKQTRVPDPASGYIPQPDFGAGNPVPGGPQIVAPQLSTVNYGDKGFTPGEILNLLRGDENDSRRVQAVNQQQAIGQLYQGQQGNTAQNTAAQGTITGGQDRVRSLFADSQNYSDQIGQQAYNRINQNLKTGQAATTSSLVNRGLGNATVDMSLNAGLARDAEDNRQGVDEQRAQRRIGLNTALAGSESDSAAKVAGLQTDQGASQNAYAGKVGSILTGTQYQDPAQQAAPGYAVAKTNNSLWGQIGGYLGGSILGGAGAGIGGGISTGIASLFGAGPKGK